MEDQDGQYQEPGCSKEHQPECGPGKTFDEPSRNGAHEGRRDNQEQNNLGGLIEERDGVNSKGDDGVDGHAGEDATGAKPEGQALDKHQESHEDGRCQDHTDDKTSQPIRAELAGNAITEEAVEEIPETARDNAGCQDVQQGWPRQGQVVVEPTLDDDVAQVESVAEEQAGQPEGAGGDAEDDEHVGQLPAANGRDAVEEDDPNDEVDRVVQDHADGLGDERGAVFHRRGEVGFPEGEQEFKFAKHWSYIGYKTGGKKQKTKSKNFGLSASIDCQPSHPA